MEVKLSLEDWQKLNWITKHQTNQQEIADLFAIADRDLKDCKSANLSTDWRMNIAYNAALQLATAALAVAGYKASRDSHHYRVIQSLAYTVNADSTIVEKFDKFRKKRNIGSYERVGYISDQEAAEMIELAESLHKMVKDWICKNHPELI